MAKNSLEMIVKVDKDGFVINIEFVRPDGSSDKIVIDRERDEEE